LLIKEGPVQAGPWISAQSAGCQSPAFVSSNSFLASSNGGIASSTTDVQRLRAGNGGQTGEQLHQVGAGEGGRDDQGQAKASVIADTDRGDDLFDVRSDLTANDVAIGLEGHGE